MTHQMMQVDGFYGNENRGNESWLTVEKMRVNAKAFQDPIVWGHTLNPHQFMGTTMLTIGEVKMPLRIVSPDVAGFEKTLREMREKGAAGVSSEKVLLGREGSSVFVEDRSGGRFTSPEFNSDQIMLIRGRANAPFVYVQDSDRTFECVHASKSVDDIMAQMGESVIAKGRALPHVSQGLDMEEQMSL